LIYFSALYRLIFPESYFSREKAFIKRHPELISQYKKILRLLELNPFHRSLKLHKLKGKFNDQSAMSINYAYRIILSFKITDNGILLIDIGHHDEVYLKG
jgi:mRNA-degrading endonuclease YafQ of YafQ-DinJ toxin-antitoxin module